MSSPAADPVATSAEPAKPGLIKRVVPFVAALVVGLGTGGLSGAFFVGPVMARGLSPESVAAVEVAKTRLAKEPQAEAGKSAEGGAEHGGKEGKDGKEGAAKPVYTLDNLVLNPAESGGSRFLLLSVTFEVADAAAAETMKGRDAELRDVVLVTLGAKTVDQLANMAAREGIKTELMTATQKLFGKSIVRVYFPQFVIQ